MILTGEDRREACPSTRRFREKLCTIYSESSFFLFASLRKYFSHQQAIRPETRGLLEEPDI
jgi:hypothetical protein